MSEKKGFSVIITGSSGMVGKGVLYECLDHPEVEAVLAINRESVGISHPKLKEILIADFFNIDSIRKELGAYDACFFCAGVSSYKMTEEEYSRITFDLTLNFARVFLEESSDSTFCYVSGTGTDTSEKSRMMWARVKGKTENTLLSLGFKAAYMFRPGYIQPMKGIRSKTRLYNTMYILFRPLYSVLKFFPGAATNTTKMGLAMINSVLNGQPSDIFANKEINLMARN